jgi:hypothetical protein
LAITEYLEIRSSPKVRVRATTSRPRGCNDAADAVDECQLGYGGSPAEHDRFLHHCAPLLGSRPALPGGSAAESAGRITSGVRTASRPRDAAAA